MIDNKLPLDSTRWNHLDCFGDPASLPELLLFLKSVEDPGASETLDEIVDTVYQQYSCCEATYAVFPYLVEKGSQLGSDRDPSLWINVGQIAGTCSDRPPQNDFLTAYEVSLTTAQVPWINVLLGGRWKVRDSYYLALSSIALSRNPIGKLFMDNFFPDKSAESTVVCPLCSERQFVAFFDSGSVVRPKDAKRPEPPLPPIPLRKPLIGNLPEISPNPWRSVAEYLEKFLNASELVPDVRAHLEAARQLTTHGVTARSDTGLVFSLLGSILFLKGYPDAGMRYLHAWDEITCPTCGSVFTFADRWWGVIS